ncbi:MAG: hypothetical protein R3F15_09515 [Lysobacterales bacterium]
MAVFDQADGMVCSHALMHGPAVRESKRSMKLARVVAAFALLLTLRPSLAQEQQMPELPGKRFAATCSGQPWGSRLDAVRAHIKAVEEWSSQTPDYEFLKQLGSGSAVEAQLIVFSPYSFFKPRRSVSGPLDCYSMLEEVLASSEDDPSGLQAWSQCWDHLDIRNRHAKRALRAVRDCLEP